MIILFDFQNVIFPIPCVLIVCFGCIAFRDTDASQNDLGQTWNGPRTDPGWTLDALRIDPHKWTRDGLKMDPSWTTDNSNVMKEWAHAFRRAKIWDPICSPDDPSWPKLLPKTDF